LFLLKPFIFRGKIVKINAFFGAFPHRDRRTALLGI